MQSSATWKDFASVLETKLLSYRGSFRLNSWLVVTLNFTVSFRPPRYEWCNMQLWFLSKVFLVQYSTSKLTCHRWVSRCRTSELPKVMTRAPPHLHLRHEWRDVQRQMFGCGQSDCFFVWGGFAPFRKVLVLHPHKRNLSQSASSCNSLEA